MTTTNDTTHLLACGHAATGEPTKMPHHHAVGMYCETCEAWTALMNKPKAETAHTPGPWECDTFGNPIIINGPSVGESNIVCFVSDNGFDTKYHYDEKTAVANARLIAASPDLIAACRRLVTGVRENSEAIISQADAMARAAIAKVEGK
jgi:hypothetical protein